MTCFLHVTLYAGAPAPACNDSISFGPDSRKGVWPLYGIVVDSSIGSAFYSGGAYNRSVPHDKDKYALAYLCYSFDV